MALKLKQSAIEKLEAEENVEKKHTILLVDDEEKNLRAMESTFAKHYNVLTAIDGKAGLEIIESMDSPETISCIISDQRMPNLTGVEFLEKSIPLIPKAVRIILTGFTDIDAIIDSVNKANIYKFLTKPMSLRELLLTVHRALEAAELEQSVLEKTARILDVEKRLEHEVDESFIASLNPKELHWFVDAIKGMIMCNKGLRKEEKGYLQTVMTFLYDKEEAKRLVSMIKTGEQETEMTPITLDKGKAFQVAVVLIKFALVDGIITKAEADFFRTACLQMGFDPIFTNRMLVWADLKKNVEKEFLILKQEVEDNFTFAAPSSAN